MITVCSPSYSITIRVEIENRIGMFARIATAISSAGGDMGAVDIVRVEKGKIIRDVTVNARDAAHEKAIVKAIRTVDGVKVLRVMDRTFSSHLGGKIEVKNRLPVRDRDDLSKVYTPGVARVCMDIHDHTDHAFRYTIKGNSVAVVSDGTAVLGLGDIGPEEAQPLARIMATGRSDYPNQINNMLGFPGIFRGLLDVRARGVNEAVKLAAAKAIAHTVEAEELTEDYIIPSLFDKKVVTAVAGAVAEAARKTGLARK